MLPSQALSCLVRNHDAEPGQESGGDVITQVVFAGFGKNG